MVVQNFGFEEKYFEKCAARIVTRLVMADSAHARRGLIEDDTPSINVSMAGVAQLAFDLFVCAFQRKVALSLVIEGRGFPVFRIVALVATFDLPSFDELARMGIPMARGATRGRQTEGFFGQLAICTSRFVTLLASNLRVSAYQWKRSLGVIEAG